MSFIKSMVKQNHFCDWLQRPSKYDEEPPEFDCEDIAKQEEYLRRRRLRWRPATFDQSRPTIQEKEVAIVDAEGGKGNLKEAKEFAILLIMKQPWLNMQKVSRIKVAHCFDGRYLFV